MSYLFDLHRYVPHGHCFSWDPQILWTSVISDALIAAAYTAIPFTLVFQIMRKRNDLPFNWMFICFATFIIACGATHVMAIITIWEPLYSLSSLVKIITALASVPTAIILFRLAPKIAKAPNVAEIIGEQKLRLRAEAANEAKDRFVAMLSHELRTPLTPVKAGIEILDEELRGLGQSTGKDAALEALRMIRDNVEMERVLIDDLLNLSALRHGKQELEVQAVDMRQICENALRLFRQSFQEKAIGLEVNLGPQRRIVRGDPVRIHQIINNLLTNALKHSPEGGKLEVKLVSGSEAVRLIIRDNGCGIETQDLERIFEPFEQLDRPAAMTQAGAGIGLGLSIAKALAEAHHGRLVAASRGRGHGATFTLELPLAASQAVESRLLPPVAAEQSKKKPQLLLVDDHPDTLRVLAQILRRAGYIVETAQTLAEAHAHLSECEVLISDIGLPDGDGCELMQHFKARGHGAGIAISGFGQAEDIRRVHDAGFACLFVKPINMADLIEAIQHVQCGGKAQTTVSNEDT